jgi:hypothetical protein
LGLGPHAEAEKIRSYFGEGEQRVKQLELLRTSTPHKLRKYCLKLMKYTLRCVSYCPAGMYLFRSYSTESAKTQSQAFKEIVDLITLLPGLRANFLDAQCMDSATSTGRILALWDRPTGLPDEE